MNIAAAEMEDWSLHAIVRGSSGDFSNFVDVERCHDYYDQSSFDYHGFLDTFPEIFDSRDGLEELYKPFYHQNNIQENPKEICVEDKQSIESDESSGNSTGADKPSATPNNYKRRKNQQKRVVVQVSADELASDKWAWRKYGQKPIKGSPYPRSYYRCSSSKGCLARKQVEQSCADPGMFIITYSAEHSHSQPTRRNSLSGTIRQKFPSPNMIINVKQEKGDQESSSNTYPNNPFSSNQVDFNPARIEHLQEPLNDFDHMIGNTDDFFSGLEDFDDFISELSNIPCTTSSSSQYEFSSIATLM